MADLSFKRLMTDGTFAVNTTQRDAWKDDLSKGVGTAVTITGDKEIGFGEADKPLLGIVTKVEFVDQGKEDMVATVAFTGTFEGIKASGVTAGDNVSVDGAGGLQKATAEGKALVIAFDTDKATIIMK